MTIIQVLSCCFPARQHMGTACPGPARRPQHPTAAAPSQIAEGTQRPCSSPEWGHQPVTAFPSLTHTQSSCLNPPQGCSSLPQPQKCPNHKGLKVTQSCCHHPPHRLGRMNKAKQVNSKQHTDVQSNCRGNFLQHAQH